MKLTNEADEESFFAELELSGPHSKDEKIAPPLCAVCAVRRPGMAEIMGSPSCISRIVLAQSAQHADLLPLNMNNFV